MTSGEMIVPLAAAVASHLAMWTAGSWLREKILPSPTRDDDRGQRAFQSAMLGFALLGAAAFALGACRALYAPLLGILVGVVAAFGLWRLVRASAWVPRGATLSDLPWIASVLFVLAHVPKALYPVLEHDENVYHLFLPKLYLASHTLSPLPWSLFANMPHLVDLSFVFPAALGGFTAAKLFVLGFFVWTLVGLAPFGRVMLGPIGPGVLAVLYLSGRVVQWHLGLAYVEPVFAALLLCALQSLWRYEADGESAHLLVLATVAGAACASKYTVWPYAAVLFATAALVRPKGVRRVGLRVLAAMVGLAALFVVPWLIKNAIVTGNPIYPNAHGVFGGTHWSPILAAQHQHELGYGRGAEKELSAYLSVPWRLVIETYTGPSFSASVMILFLASMVFPWRRREFASTLRLVAMAGFVLWCCGPKQTRYLLAWTPVMVVTAGLALAPLRRFRSAFASVVMAIVAVALAQVRWQPYTVEPFLDVFTVSREELLSRNLCWDLTEFLNGIVPEGRRVLSFWENRLYFLDRPFIADSTFGAPIVLGGLREAGDAHVFATKLAAEGVTHVVVNTYYYRAYMANEFVYNMIDEKFYPAERLAADKDLFDRFVSTELTAVPWDGAWPVFRLRAAPLPAGP